MSEDNEQHSIIEDPPFLRWSISDASTWIENLGFPQYKECFEKNFITGRKLILIDSSRLTRMGVSIFEDIKAITAAIRELLNIKLIPYGRNLSYLPREPWALYLEEKSKTGSRADNLTYSDYLKEKGWTHSEE